MTGKNLYELLGVSETASADEIKRAYRELAKKYHPDRTGGDKKKEARFKEINAAYEILSDEQKRAQYDAIRRGGGRGRGGRGGFPGVDFDLGGVGQGIGLDELFAQFFGGAAGPGGGARVIIEEVGPFGRRRRTSTTNGRPGAAEPQAAAEETVWIGGHAFTRRGDDLYADLPLTIEEAVLGGKVEVPTPDGLVTVTVPAGTSSGRKLRLRGKGWQGRGDLYAVAQIVVPTQVDERARELLREFARRAPVKPRR